MKEKILAFVKKYFTPIAVVAACLFFGYHMRPRADAAGDWHVRDFGRLPVIEGGRHKPMDTVARTKLMILTHRQYYYDADARVYHPATKWLLDVQTSPPGNDPLMGQLLPNGAQNMPAFTHKIFRIENDQLLEWLELKRRDGLRYSFEEILAGGPNVKKFAFEAERIRRKDPKTINLFEGKLLELAEHIQQYMNIATHNTPLAIPNLAGDDQWATFRDIHEKFLPDDDAKPVVLPDTAEANTYRAYRELLQAYDAGDRTEFNRVLSKHLATLEKEQPALMRSVGVEVFFNDFAPFYHCLEIYAVLAVLCCIAWLIPDWTRTIQRGCFAAMAVAFLVHLSGLIIRMYLQDRMFVFVTNLYSSAVFIGLGAVFFCLVSEMFFKNGIAVVVGCVGGFLSLIIAHMLSLSGDTLEMMQAVLDTNFWLATHVTCITLGYVSAFVAGLMGIAYIFLGVFTNMLRKEGSANLTRMTYGVLCAGMFLSFVGTVLGGLWADYSWGRFWGWDPKENGALLIVIWIALILHARWAGLAKHRGIAVLSVLGIIVTSWSWFGTNFLGVGLHSYGFRQGAMMSLILIDCVFLAIAGLGMLPLHVWTSFRAPSQVGPAPLTKATPRPVSV